MKKIILTLMCLTVVLCMIPVTASAVSAEGSIEIDLTSGTHLKQPVSGIRLSLYKIAYVDDSDTYGYSMTQDFEKSGITVKSIAKTTNISKIAGTLKSYVSDNDVQPLATEISGSSGQVIFSGLEDGVYLIVQTNSESDFNSLSYTYATDPFIVKIPSTKNGSKRNIVCKPKGSSHSKTPEYASLTVYKLWKDESDKKGLRPDSIKVGLYKDNTLEEEVTLSAANNWMHKWTGLNAGSSWSVKEMEVPDNYTSSITSVDNEWTITNTVDDTPVPPDETPSEETPQSDTPSSDTPTTDTPTGSTSHAKNPKTGDSGFGIWGILMIASASIIIFGAGRRRE